jgi:hypothetical protein
MRALSRASFVLALVALTLGWTDVRAACVPIYVGHAFDSYFLCDDLTPSAWRHMDRATLSP